MEIDPKTVASFIGMSALVYGFAGRLIVGYLRFNRLNNHGVEIFNNYWLLILTGVFEFLFMLTFVPAVLFGLFMIFITNPLLS